MVPQDHVPARRSTNRCTTSARHHEPAHHRREHRPEPQRRLDESAADDFEMNRCDARGKGSSLEGDPPTDGGRRGHAGRPRQLQEVAPGSVRGTEETAYSPCSARSPMRCSTRGASATCDQFFDLSPVLISTHRHPTPIGSPTATTKGCPQSQKQKCFLNVPYQRCHGIERVTLTIYYYELRVPSG